MNLILDSLRVLPLANGSIYSSSTLGTTAPNWSLSGDSQAMTKNISLGLWALTVNPKSEIEDLHFNALKISTRYLDYSFYFEES